MKKTTLPVSVKNLMKYKDEGSLILDSPIQRKSGRWNALSQSMLLHSMLSDFIVPNLYFSKVITDDKKSQLIVLDGLQRLSTVFAYVKGEWRTHAKTPKVTVDGVEYDISLKKFDEQNPDVQNAILQYRFGTYQLEECTEEEIEETFARLNNGVALATIEKARPVMGTELASWLNQLCENSIYYQESICLTPAQLRKADDFLMLITTLMLIDALYYTDFAIKNSASAAECLRYSADIRDNMPEDKKELLEKLTAYLDEAFVGKERTYLRKNNIPIINLVAVVFMEAGLSAKDFAKGIDDFYGSPTEEYQEASGAGNVKVRNVRTRLHELTQFMLDKFGGQFPDGVSVPLMYFRNVEVAGLTPVESISASTEEGVLPTEEGSSNEESATTDGVEDSVSAESSSNDQSEEGVAQDTVPTVESAESTDTTEEKDSAEEVKKTSKNKKNREKAS